MRLPPRRQLAVAVLVAAVAALHLLVTHLVSQRMADLAALADMPHRLEVTYVRELELAPPPAVAPVVAPPPKAPPHPAAAPLPARPASAPPVAEETASAPAAAPPVAEPTPDTTPVAEAPAASAVAADAASADPAAPAAEGEAFQWPVSTRLTYALTGNYRGEVNGDAQVEWVRVGTRYQVHIDIGVGPLISRRMSSEGELVGERLLPSRYDEETRVLFREPRRVTILLGPQEIVLANGDRLPRADGVQDSASQFIQLAALFATRPALLQPGGTIEILLALRNRVGAWTYDVLGQEEIRTPIGLLDTVHLRPRRVMSGGTELTAEVWFAPQLRFLPVRMRVRQDEATYLDLVLAQKPEIAAQ